MYIFTAWSVIFYINLVRRASPSVDQQHVNNILNHQRTTVYMETSIPEQCKQLRFQIPRAQPPRPGSWHAIPRLFIAHRSQSHTQASCHASLCLLQDCMDGKQARRTGSSSPLGQLFDHGCDAFVL